jgi:SAM-dependent methyltransferase
VLESSIRLETNKQAGNSSSNLQHSINRVLSLSRPVCNPSSEVCVQSSGYMKLETSDISSEMERFLTGDTEQSCYGNAREAGVAKLVQTVALRAVTHLAGPMKGRDALDLACGDGSLSRWLARHGAQVIGVDNTPERIEKARQLEAQEPHGIKYLVGNADDLYMLEDQSVDDVFCSLSFSRMENVSSVVAEISRIVRLGGRFVFAVGHPCFQIQNHSRPPEVCHVDNYFAEGERDGIYGAVRHRTLSTYVNAVAARGFTVRRMMESSPEEREVAGDPVLKSWINTPVALAIEAVFPRI